MSQFKTALITGASMGIGKDIAQELAGQVDHLILVARSEKALNELAATLAEQYKIKTTVIAQDLAVPGAAEALHTKTLAFGVDILVNNAGFGLKGSFLDLPLIEQQKMMHLNMITLTELCHLYGTDMVKQGKGRIMNVASVAAFQAGPKMAIYCATKAFVLSFSEALDVEMQAKGVRVTALCPGAVDTNFHDVAKNDSKLLLSTAMQPGPVAKAGVNAMLRGKRVVIPGWLNLLTIFSVRLMPRRAVNSLTLKMIDG